MKASEARKLVDKHNEEESRLLALQAKERPALAKAFYKDKVIPAITKSAADGNRWVSMVLEYEEVVHLLRNHGYAVTVQEEWDEATGSRRDNGDIHTGGKLVRKLRASISW